MPTTSTLGEAQARNERPATAGTRGGEAPYNDGTIGGRRPSPLQVGRQHLVCLDKDSALDVVATAAWGSQNYRSVYKWWAKAGPFAP